MKIDIQTYDYSSDINFNMFDKGEIPFLRLLLPLLLGIGFAWFLPQVALIPWIGICLLLIFFIFILFLACYQKASLYRYSWIFGSLIHVFLFALGYLICIQTDERSDPAYFTGNTAAEALVLQMIQEPKSTGSIIRFEADVIQSLKNETFHQVTGKLMVVFKRDSIHPLHLKYGDVLLVPAVFHPIKSAANPGEFDFKNYLTKRRIYYQTFLRQQEIIILKQHTGIALVAFAIEWRNRLVRKFYTYLDKEAGSFASALILGYRSDLNQAILHTYSQTGTMHVLAVSGMHVGIVFLLLDVLLKSFNKTRRMQFLRAMIIIFAIWFYALITGFSPSVCRATIMLSFVIIGRALGRDRNTYNLLAISAFLLLLYNPLYFFDLGFQLSYLAVIGLVYLHPKIYRMIYCQNKLLDHIWHYSALSIAAQVATFPISMYYFHQFPVYFLLSNLFIVFPISILMYLGILFLVIPFIILLKPLGLMLGWIILFSNLGLRYIQQIPFVRMNEIWINTWQCVLIYILIICLLWLCMEARKKVFLIFTGSLVLLLSSITYHVIQNHNRHELIFYSLRKNTAIGYIFRNKGTVITDLHDTDKAFDFSVKPAISTKGANLDEILSVHDSARSATYRISPNLMQFGHFKILRWNKSFNQRYLKPMHVDAILLGYNATIMLSDLLATIHFSILLIDGTNSYRHIRKLEREAQLLHIPYHVLVNEGAYIVKL